MDRQESTGQTSGPTPGSTNLRGNGRARIFAPRAGPTKAVVVELACRSTRLSGRAVGTHYGGISASAVSNIRRRVRQWQDGILSVIDRLAAPIRTAEPATVQSVK